MPKWWQGKGAEESQYKDGRNTSQILGAMATASRVARVYIFDSFINYTIVLVRPNVKRFRALCEFYDTCIK